MKKMTGSWGLYPWYDEHGADLVHPDDLKSFRSLVPSGKVFECTRCDDFLTLRYKDHQFRVKKDLFRPVDTPAYTFGQCVTILETGAEATVDEIHWHHQRGEPMFFLIRQGRRLKRRFWARDLVARS